MLVSQVAGIWRCTSAAGAARAIDARSAFKDGESHTYLSCSRTLGDPELKANPERPILSNQPDTSVTKLLAQDLFVVLACDGVWDVLTDQQARSHSASRPFEPLRAPRPSCLTHRARDRVARVRWWTLCWSTGATPPPPRLRS